MTKRRARLAEQGLKEASSVIVPIHREADLRALAKQWTEDHLLAREGGAGQSRDLEPESDGDASGALSDVQSPK